MICIHTLQRPVSTPLTISISLPLVWMYIILTFSHQDLTPVEEEEDEDDDSIGAGSYVGGLVCIVFLIIILCTYLGSR